jgi:ketosteroid isomerase-like protein
LPYLTVGDYRDGWSLAGHLYPADRLDAALAKFAELDRATATPTHENEVTATDEDARVSPSVVLAMTVFADAYMQADWSAMEELFATDQVIDDRRAGLGTEVVGRDAIIDMYRLAAADLGFKRFRYDVVATRGDRLGLFRALVFDDSDNEVELLALNALDADGRFGTGAVYFDLVDLDAAFDELDDRWLASPESSELDECFFGLARSYNARDWDRMRSLLADDIIHVDHRTLGSGILTGADEYMRRLRSGVDLSDDRQLRVTDVRLIDGGGRVFASTIVGRSDDGGQMEWLDLRVLAVRDGKIVSAEQFPADGLDDAIARARELADG